MKKIILIVCALITVIMCFAQKQLKDWYNVNLGNSLECNIDFYSNGKFELAVLNKAFSDGMLATVLSKGSYTVKGDRITLFDSCTGFQILCERKSDELIILKGFPFMLQHVLKKYGNTFGTKDIQPAFDPKKIQNERNKYKQAHPDNYPLYYSQYINSIYVLEIKKENKYALRFRGLLLSEGIWKRNGNELLLFDKALQHTYYVLISKEGLIGKYLPGNFYDLILYEKNYPMKNEISIAHYITYRSPTVEKKVILGPVMQDRTFSHVEQMPQFPDGGDEALSRFIKENIRYPDVVRKGGIKGRVILRFVIEKDGTVDQIEVQRKLCDSCDAEAIRVIRSMPKWIPGKQNGFPVAVYYTIAVYFD